MRVVADPQPGHWRLHPDGAARLADRSPLGSSGILYLQPAAGHAAVVERAEDQPVAVGRLLELQRLVGNTAVTDLIIQRDAPAPASALPGDAPTLQPVPAAALSEPGKIIPAPPPVTGIPWSPIGEGEGPHRGVDIAADAKNVTITFVYKDWNFPKSKEDAVIGWMHEPNVSIQVSQTNASPAVIQAAISAINIHLRRHAEDFIELSVSPQVGVQPDDTSQTSVGVQAQAELHVTATFSLTATSTVAGSRNKDTGRVDIQWDPISVGVLYHLESGKEKVAPSKRSEQVDDTIGWIESNFDASTLDDGGKDENLKDGEDAIILRLINGMKAVAGKGEADIDLDLGAHARPLPPRLEEGLLQLVRLIKFSHPPLESITNVKVNIWRQAPGSNETTVMGVFNLKPGPQPGTPGDYPAPKAGRRRA